MKRFTFLALLFPLCMALIPSLPEAAAGESAEGWSYPTPGLPGVSDEELPEDMIEPFNLSDWAEPFETPEEAEEAQPSPRPRRKAPVRELFIEFISPLDRFEANTRAWYSANQLLGAGSDLLGVHAGLDDYLPGRVFLLATGAFLSGALSYYSHEMGHTYEEIRKGARPGFETDWSSLVTLGYPKYVKTFAPDDTEWTLEEDCRATVGGLNQTTGNGWFAWERAQVVGAWDFHTGLAFLEGKLDHILQLYVGCQDRESENDANAYIRYLGQNGVRLRRGEYLTQALVADLLSWPVLESVLAVGNYLITGDRRFRATRIPIAKRFAVGPPLLSVFLTPEGGFYELGFFLFCGALPPLEISIGRRADFFGESEVRGVRLGAKHHGLPLFRRSGWYGTVSPFAYLTVTRSARERGTLSGVEIAMGRDPFAVTLRVEYGFRDVIRHTVQGEEGGWSAVLGLRVRL
ncbi:MAG: hypothetical protein ACYS47_07410 [Planctomycetota bacterium]